VYSQQTNGPDSTIETSRLRPTSATRVETMGLDVHRMDTRASNKASLRASTVRLHSRTKAKELRLRCGAQHLFSFSERLPHEIEGSNPCKSLGVSPHQHHSAEVRGIKSTKSSIIFSGSALNVERRPSSGSPLRPWLQSSNRETHRCGERMQDS